MPRFILGIDKRGSQALSKRLIALAITFVMLNILDNVLTHLILANGGYELNPIARWGLERNEGAFWLVEGAIATAGIVLLLLLARKYPRAIEKIFVGLVIAMVGVCLFNGMSL